MRKEYVKPSDTPLPTASPGSLGDKDLTPPGHRSGFVTLFGRSNVGKSTLLNRLVGEKVAIVTEVPQTTRRRIQGIRTYADCQIVFVDTPGVHKPRYRLNQRMVSAAVSSLDGVDLVVLLIDGDAGLGPGDRFVMRLAEERGVPSYLVVNKIDRMEKSRILEVIAEATRDRSFEEVVPVSALTGENVDRLETLIRKRLPTGPRYFPPGLVTDAPERFLTAEILREKLILSTKEELPHSTAVIIERQEESRDGVLQVDALVVVERDSQKGILIGKKGEMMKRIASAARHEMEARLGGKVFLQVWVKVAKNWRMDQRFLDHLGLEGREAVAIQPADDGHKRP
jgi:GTP-binding protein Era